MNTNRSFQTRMKRKNSLNSCRNSHDFSATKLNPVSQRFLHNYNSTELMQQRIKSLEEELLKTQQLNKVYETKLQNAENTITQFNRMNSKPQEIEKYKQRIIEVYETHLYDLHNRCSQYWENSNNAKEPPVLREKSTSTETIYALTRLREVHNSQVCTRCRTPL